MLRHMLFFSSKCVPSLIQEICSSFTSRTSCTRSPQSPISRIAAFLLKDLGFPREHFVFAPWEPHVPGAVFVPFGSYCVLLKKINALSGVEIYSQQGLFPAQSRIFARYCRNVQLAPSSWSVRTHEEISEVITHLVGKTVQHTEN
jgi:hypothetical protein